MKKQLVSFKSSIETIDYWAGDQILSQSTVVNLYSDRIQSPVSFSRLFICLLTWSSYLILLKTLSPSWFNTCEKAVELFWLWRNPRRKRQMTFIGLTRSFWEVSETYVDQEGGHGFTVQKLLRRKIYYYYHHHYFITSRRFGDNTLITGKNNKSSSSLFFNALQFANVFISLIINATNATASLLLYHHSD